MKHIRHILLLVLVITFMACGSSDNGMEDPIGMTDDGPEEVDRSQNLLATGASANDILSNTNFDRLLIEVTFAPGFRPTEEAMNNFQDYLRENTFKDDIEVIYREIPSPGEESFTLEEIDDLEQENRTAFNDGSTLAIYIFFADAPSDGDDLDEGLVTVGAVFRNTSMVIYERTIRILASGSGFSAQPLVDIETATLNHEFGHLFGLVNLGTVAINDHEDVDAPNHCNVPGCLMQAQLQFGTTSRVASAIGKEALTSPCSLSGAGMLKLLEQQAARGSQVVPVLDPECLLDLSGNGGRPVSGS